MRPASGVLPLLAMTAFASFVLPPPARGGSILPQIETALEQAELGEIPQSPLGKHLIEVAPGVYVAVNGKKERRQVRFARWFEMLEDDRRETYVAEGFPTHRHFENDGGVRTEHWSYLDRGITYVFLGNTRIDVRLN